MTCKRHGGNEGSIICRECDLETIDADRRLAMSKPDQRAVGDTPLLCWTEGPGRNYPAYANLTFRNGGLVIAVRGKSHIDHEGELAGFCAVVKVPEDAALHLRDLARVTAERDHNWRLSQVAANSIRELTARAEAAERFRAFVEWCDLYGAMVNVSTDPRGSLRLTWYRGECFADSWVGLIDAVDAAIAAREPVARDAANGFTINADGARAFMR